jgi:ribosome-associated heat shock protein Hsp15
VWLDVACLFKTRSLARTACQGGKVELNGRSARPSRLLRKGDELRITRGGGRSQIVVVQDFAVGMSRAWLTLSTRTGRRRSLGLEARLRRILSVGPIRVSKRERRALRRLKEGG